MRVVLDTNVVLAALLTKGLAADVFQYCFENHEGYFSHWILDEIVENLRDKFGISGRRLEGTIEFLRNGAQIVDPEGEPPSVCRDEDDNSSWTGSRCTRSVSDICSRIAVRIRTDCLHGVLI